MRLVEKDVAGWVAEKLGHPIHPPYQCLAVEDDFYTVRGGVVLNDWNGANIEVTLYAPGCFRRSLIAEIFDYAFRVCGATRLSAHTESHETEHILSRLGFEAEGLRENYYGPGRHASVWRLDPDKAERWMK